MTEHASSTRSLAALTHSLSQAHPSIVRGVNAARRKLGLPEVAVRGNPLARPPRIVPTTTGVATTNATTASRGGRVCKTAQARWAGLKLSAAVAIGRARMNARR